MDPDFLNPEWDKGQLVTISEDDHQQIRLKTIRAAQ